MTLDITTISKIPLDGAFYAKSRYAVPIFIVMLSVIMQCLFVSAMLSVVMQRSILLLC